LCTRVLNRARTIFSRSSVFFRRAHAPGQPDLPGGRAAQVQARNPVELSLLIAARGNRIAVKTGGFNAASNCFLQGFTAAADDVPASVDMWYLTKKGRRLKSGALLLL